MSEHWNHHEEEASSEEQSSKQKSLDKLEEDAFLGRQQYVSTEPERRTLNIYLPLLFAFILMLGMQLGFKMYEKLKGGEKQTSISKIPEIEEVLHYIDENYVDEVKNEELVEKAIENMLKELDPHSNYIAARELEGINESLRGNFEGIGVEFSIVKDTILVVAAITGGPSDKLGIRAGDKIIEIEDSLVAGIGIKSEGVVKLLKGDKGTVVNVRIYRKGVPELLSFDIKRDRIPLVSVDVNYMMDDEVGYMKITRFSATTYEEFRMALESLQERGMKKLILDLRENPGGYLSAAVDIADEFIEGNNLLVYTKGKNYKRRSYNARRRGIFEDGDLVVLINEGSASASEIVSGAVQDWDRGLIMGNRSFGKGLVQEQYNLSNESALRLTVARYYTPSGRCIQKPYKSGEKDYEEELGKRALDSKRDTTSIPDSLKHKTLIEGRLVYGGGGVSPDVIVPYDTTGMESFMIRTRSLVPQFVYDYFSNNRTYFTNTFKTFDSFQEDFAVNADLFKQFKSHLKKEIGIVDEKLLKRDREELDTYLKAYIARQLWNNEGFYPIIQQSDKTLQAAYQKISSGLAAN